MSEKVVAKVVSDVVEKLIASGEVPEELREFAMQELERDLRMYIGRKLRRVAILVDSAVTLRMSGIIT